MKNIAKRVAADMSVEAQEVIERILSNINTQALIEAKQEAEANHEANGGKGELKLSTNFYLHAVVQEFFEAINRANSRLGKVVMDGTKYMYIYTTYWERIKIELIEELLKEASFLLSVPGDVIANPKFIFSIIGVADKLIPYYSVENSNKVLLAFSDDRCLEVDRNGWRIRKKTRDDFFDYRLSYTYSPNHPMPRFQAYLDKVLPDKEAQMLLQEADGAYLIRHEELPLQKMTMIMGVANSGKSVHQNIMKKIFGPKMSTKTLYEITDPQAGARNRYELQYSYVNYPEEATEIQSADDFKTLAVGGEITIRDYHRRGASISRYAKLAINSNHTLSAASLGNEITRRLLVIPFEVEIKKEEVDITLVQKITDEELPGILNWMLEGLDRLLKNKKFTEPAYCTDYLEKLRNNDNSIGLFINSRGYSPVETDVFTQKKVVLVETFYKEYLDYCKEFSVKHCYKQSKFSQLAVSEFKFARANPKDENRKTLNCIVVYVVPDPKKPSIFSDNKEVNNLSTHIKNGPKMPTLDLGLDSGS
jgi:putative DNA primase/helicase